MSKLELVSFINDFKGALKYIDLAIDFESGEHMCCHFDHNLTDFVCAVKDEEHFDTFEKFMDCIKQYEHLVIKQVYVYSGYMNISTRPY